MLFNPLNYRGIILQCIAAKVYSSVLNNKFITYLQENELLVDEQNRFRRQISWLNHNCSLNSITQNNKSTFVTFIDLQQTFDTVGRELLQYCLQPMEWTSTLYRHRIVRSAKRQINWLVQCWSSTRRQFIPNIIGPIN